MPSLEIITGGHCILCGWFYTRTRVYYNLDRNIFIVIFEHPDGRVCATDVLPEHRERDEGGLSTLFVV